jgi:hypothetical protein
MSSLGLSTSSPPGGDDLVAAHADVAVDAPDGDVLVVLAARVPGDRVLVVGVDEIAVDVEGGRRPLIMPSPPRPIRTTARGTSRSRSHHAITVGVWKASVTSRTPRPAPPRDAAHELARAHLDDVLLLVLWNASVVRAGRDEGTRSARGDSVTR